MRKSFRFLCLFTMTAIAFSSMKAKTNAMDCQFNPVITDAEVETNVKVNKMGTTKTSRLESIVIPDVDPPKSYEEVRNRILAWKEKIPTGTTWTNSTPYGSEGYLGNAYRSKTSDKARLGFGCEAFALLLSDVAFGDLPAIQYASTDVTFEDIRVGDILRVNNDKHSVIVIQTDTDSLTIAEGNYNKKVKWGRVISKKDVMDNLTIF